MLTCLLNNQQICSLDLKDKYDEYIMEKLEYVKEASQNRQLVCEECGDIVILRAGNDKVPHFAHKNKNESCYWEKYGKKETEEHKKGKSIIYQYLKEKYIDAEISVNYRHSNIRRSDVFAKFKSGTQLAVEFLRIDMKITDWKEKHDFYKSNNINNIWLLSTKEYNKQDIKNVSIDFFEKFLAYKSDDDIIKFLNTKQQSIILIKKMEYKGRAYYKELFTKEYKIQDILIDMHGTINCDFKIQYDKAYQNFINNVLKREKTKKKAKSDKKFKVKTFKISEEQDKENREYVKKLIEQEKAKRNKK
ncbi:hypothetical protein JMF89_01250 [Clostridiaceae bacterium UIB06]|uniref:Competence protein n=1 Tax=Clostridium thailandense TaxID=2794346 RepID=A0A949TND9_9CLOT|nr:competence protein CoiA family protein [Clostridium thailandense]MBV7276054.1 hypothetical protein [Clostridium thailandense]MCH5135841.1 hypothetical protein [Clostridiaceae bacterium UIB06]